MKLKSLLSILVISVSIGFAQVPSYLPSNGLVGWWPFNGNAIDVSGNGNNGTVNGATLTNDRNGNSNGAYYFSSSGCATRIDAAINTSNILTGLTISIWLSRSGQGCIAPRVLEFYVPGDGPGEMAIGWDNTGYGNIGSVTSNSNYIFSAWTKPLDNIWTHLVYTNDGINGRFYQDGILKGTVASTGNPILSGNVAFGRMNHPANDAFNGKLDDIGIWNRALTSTEITALYNASPCLNDLTISPALNTLQIGNTATFTATTSNPNPNLVWQSDFGQGYQTLNNFGNYSGVNTNTLSISNIQLSAHNQPIRVIANSGNCIDTSNVATISISDTCTTLISVTDTLIINTSITGITPPNNLNTIKVFPNPANDHVTINYGSNFASMNGYSLKITNAIGQVVFATLINQQSSYVDLSTWSGNGIYFLQILDTQNNIIENRKIILQ